MPLLEETAHLGPLLIGFTSDVCPLSGDTTVQPARDASLSQCAGGFHNEMTENQDPSAV